MNHDLYPAVLAAFDLADRKGAPLADLIAYDQALTAWLGVDSSSFGFEIGEAEDRGYDPDRIYYGFMGDADTDAAILYLGHATGMIHEAITEVNWPGPIPAVYLTDENQRTT